MSPHKHRMAKYVTIVYASNRHPGLGKEVIVYAENSQDAVNRAVEIGWGGRPCDARVRIRSVEDTPPECEAAS